MSTPRKLGEIASNLDDMSVTLEEIKDTVEQNQSADTKQLDEIQDGIDRAVDAIEDTVDPDNRREH